MIAERTLAVAGMAGSRRPRRWAIPALLVFLVGLLAGGGLWLRLRGQDALPAVTTAVGTAPAPPGSATLNVSAWPTATLYLDGRRLNESTPVRNLAVPAGSHKLTLISAGGGGQRKEYTLTLKDGDTRTLAVVLDK